MSRLQRSTPEGLEAVGSPVVELKLGTDGAETCPQRRRRPSGPLTCQA